MKAVLSLPRRATYADYLAAEQNSERRYELIDGVIVALPGGSDEHNAIAARFWPGGPGGPQLNRHQVLVDPSGNPQSWFGHGAAVGRFDGSTVEIAVTAHGARTIYIYRAGASKPDRTIARIAGDSPTEKIAAVDLNADGRDELVVFTDREVFALTGARADAVLARQARSP